MNAFYIFGNCITKLPLSDVTELPQADFSSSVSLNQAKVMT